MSSINNFVKIVQYFLLLHCKSLHDSYLYSRDLGHLYDFLHRKVALLRGSRTNEIGFICLFKKYYILKKPHT